MRHFLIGLIFVLSSTAFAVPVYNCKVTSQSETTVTGTSSIILYPNPNRKCLLVQNKGTNLVYVKLTSSQAGSSTTGILIGAGQNWEPYWVPTNALYADTAGGLSTSGIYILEGN